MVSSVQPSDIALTSFGIKAKQMLTFSDPLLNIALTSFGIKAKRVRANDLGVGYIALTSFGIKAKQKAAASGMILILL